MHKSREGTGSQPPDDAAGPQGRAASEGNGSKIAWLVGPGFLALAAFIVFGMPAREIPLTAAPAIREASILGEPLRSPMSDPPITFINGFDRRCNDCHRIIEPRENSQANLQQHTNIVLRHGLNNNCYNCHDRTNREMLVLHDGSTIGYADPEMLCAQCHGRVYRDWTRGAHGKTVGSWEVTLPEFRRLTCTECHDPHAPMFAPIEPLPSPVTLRMGTPIKGEFEHGKSNRNPLLRWSEGSQTNSTSGGGHE